MNGVSAFISKASKCANSLRPIPMDFGRKANAPDDAGFPTLIGKKACINDFRASNRQGAWGPVKKTIASSLSGVYSTKDLYKKGDSFVCHKSWNGVII